MGRKGLTWAEALIALVLVCVLATLLVVLMGRARTRPGQHQDCTRNLHFLGLAYECYVSDFGQWPMGDTVHGGSSEQCFALLCPAYQVQLEWLSCPQNPTKVKSGKDRWGNPVILNTGYRQDAGDVPTQKPDFNGIPVKGKTFRAVAADRSTKNHEGRSVVLFFDKHTETLMGTTKGVVPNTHLPDMDSDIYADEDPNNTALNQDEDCDLD